MRRYKFYPLAELIQCVLNSADGFIIDIVNILQDGQRTDFANDPGKQTVCHFSVVPDGKGLACQLREQRPDSLAYLLTRARGFLSAVIELSARLRLGIWALYSCSL